jgi:hypothetical protein
METEEDSTRWRDLPHSWVGRINIVKMLLQEEKEAGSPQHPTFHAIFRNRIHVKSIKWVSQRRKSHKVNFFFFRQGFILVKLDKVETNRKGREKDFL